MRVHGFRRQASSHSSTLLVFDEKFQIVYQDHLLEPFEIGHDGERIVVKSGTNRLRGITNGSWVYCIP